MYHQYGRTALHSAASGGHTETVKLILDRGINVDTTANVSSMRLDRQIMTMCVCESSHSNHNSIFSWFMFFIKMIITVISIIDVINDTVVLWFMYHQNRCTAFHSAARGGHTEIVKLLLDRRVDVDTADVVSNIRLYRQIMTMCVWIIAQQS